MSNIQPPFEFDQRNELHRKAQHYLETMDRDVFPSFGDVMVTAIVEYFDRYYAIAMAEIEEVPQEPAEEGYGSRVPGVEAREAEGSEEAEEPLDEMDLKIQRAVERAMDKMLPAMIDQIVQRSGELSHADEDADKDGGDEDPKGDEAVDLSSVEADISWGFLQG